mgnify:CR=1 FL=1
MCQELLKTDTDMTYVNVQQLPQQGSPTLPALQQLASSENAPLFINAEGKLVFWSRNTIFSEYVAPYIDLADDGTGMPYANRAVRVMLDGDAVRNSVTVVDSLNRAITVTNEASVTANGIAAETFDTVLVDVDSATELAERMVTIFADPDLDLEPITVQGQRDPNYWTYLLGLDLLFKFSFKRTPPVGSQISREMLVQQLVWNITPSTWEVSIKGSARYTGWFTVGLSLVGGSDVVL